MTGGELVLPGLYKFNPKEQKMEKPVHWSLWHWVDMSEVHLAFVNRLKPFLKGEEPESQVMPVYKSFFPRSIDGKTYLFSWIVYNSQNGEIAFHHEEIEKCPLPKPGGICPVKMHEHLFVPAKWSNLVLQMAEDGISEICFQEAEDHASWYYGLRVDNTSKVYHLNTVLPFASPTSR